MGKTVFPEAASLKFPPGTLARIKEAARQDGTSRQAGKVCILSGKEG